MSLKSALQPTVTHSAPANALLFAAPTSISYEELKQLLIDCREGDVCTIEKVVFTVESGEQGDALFKDGTRLPITGIPEDNPTNDSSPYKLVAKCRDAKVPYSFPFAEGLSKYKSKKNDAATAPNIISAPYLKRVQESMQQKSPF